MMHVLYIALFAFSLLACSQAKNQQQEVTTVSQTPMTTTPSFNADSAYVFVENQVKFGPRVPNTDAHKACGNYLASELKRFGAKIYEQEAMLTAYDNTGLEAKNIIGSFNPENDKRILLSPIGIRVLIPTTIPTRLIIAKRSTEPTTEPAV